MWKHTNFYNKHWFKSNSVVTYFSQATGYITDTPTLCPNSSTLFTIN